MDNLGVVITSLLGEHYLALSASLVLLCLSATFSGCETSLFSLSPPQLNRLRSSHGRIDRVVVHLHGNLKSLLPTILFCNMAVNVLIYALSAAIAGDLGGIYGPGATLLYSLANLFVVVFFGEVFPKQLAISSSMLAARLTALPVWICSRVAAKPMIVLNALVAALERVFGGGKTKTTALREEELRLLVEVSKNDGVISDGEYELLDGIVDLPEVRLRDIMVPRVDVPALAFGATLEEALTAARKARHCKLPVLDAMQDEMAGWVDVRDIYAAAGRAPDAALTTEAFIRDFRFFSEHDRADQVLERIKGEAGADLFAVVDERGHTIGFFTMQDIMDEILGHFGEHGAPPPDEVREVGGSYLLSGRLSIREWRQLFAIPVAVPRNVTTVSGLVTTLLGRVPRPRDTVTIANMEMTVIATRHHRVTEVALKLIDPAPTTPAEGGKTP